MKNSIRLLLLGILVISLALGINSVLAHRDSAPATAPSPIHPTYSLLDANGVHVLESRKPVSTMQTCGQCHDTEFIVSHSYPFRSWPERL